MRPNTMITTMTTIDKPFLLLAFEVEDPEDGFGLLIIVDDLRFPTIEGVGVACEIRDPGTGVSTIIGAGGGIRTGEGKGVCTSIMEEPLLLEESAFPNTMKKPTKKQNRHSK